MALVATPKMRVVPVDMNANTYDIVNEVLRTYLLYKDDTCGLAKQLKGSTKIETLRNIWEFVKKNFKYKTDPVGYQYVQRPAVLWRNRVGDCKSFSIFIGSLLNCLGIPFVFRFTSHRDTTTPHHVFVVVPDGDKEIILDATLSRFNYQKPYTFKIDYDMSKLYRIEGVHESGKLDLPEDIENMTEAELELAIAKQRLEIERDIAAELRGIGSVRVEKYNDILEAVNDALEAARRGDYKEMYAIAYMTDKGEYSDTQKALVAGINDAAEIGLFRKRNRRKRRKRKKFLKKLWQKTKKAVSRAAKKATRFLKTAADKVAKGVKAFGRKVLNIPKAVVRKILQVLLPVASPMFLYIFVKNPSVLPPKARRKYNKQMKIFKLITQKLGMKESQVKAIIRNGIMKRFKKSPETVLREMFGARVAGIGNPKIAAVLSKVPWDTVINALISIISKLLKKKMNVNDMVPDASDVPADVMPTTQDVPSYDDFSEMTPEQAKKGLDMVRQTKSEYVVPDDAGSDTTGGRSRFWTI